MVKEEKPYIINRGVEYRCYKAGYYNPIQHKWHFVIDGVESPIISHEQIEFMGMILTVCFTCRRLAETTRIFNNVSGKETYIEAWQI